MKTGPIGDANQQTEYIVTINASFCLALCEDLHSNP